MRSATTGFFSTFASTKSLMRHRSSQRLKNVSASLYEPGPCDTVKAVVHYPTGLRRIKRSRDGARSCGAPDQPLWGRQHPTRGTDTDQLLCQYGRPFSVTSTWVTWWKTCSSLRVRHCDRTRTDIPG